MSDDSETIVTQQNRKQNEYNVTKARIDTTELLIRIEEMFYVV